MQGGHFLLNHSNTKKTAQYNDRLLWSFLAKSTSLSEPASYWRNSLFLSRTHKTLCGTSAVSSDQEECYVLFIAKLWERTHTSCIWAIKSFLLTMHTAHVFIKHWIIVTENDKNMYIPEINSKIKLKGNKRWHSVC